LGSDVTYVARLPAGNGQVHDPDKGAFTVFPDDLKLRQSQSPGCRKRRAEPHEHHGEERRAEPTRCLDPAPNP
jgi:hypothetical protein